MPEIRLDEEETAPTTLESVGQALLRATVVAMVVGGVESMLVSRAIGASANGLAVALAGLWLPAALLFIWPGGKLAERIENPSTRNVPLAVLAIAFVGALVFLLRLGGAGTPVYLRALPIEIISALVVATLVSFAHPAAALRKPLAIGGLLLAIFLQLYATRWVDAHRGYSGAVVERTGVPRLMLKNVWRRFV